ncbi:hypothetical protein MalM25_34820 [Planctomycetes bacterium MalM25]|nr:hypothetical protein MalM25_34820 [Planctomycetes bacterium MalM25]
MTPLTEHTDRTIRPAALPLALVVLALCGCGEKKQETVFDEISRMPTREELVEIEVGEFVVPVPIVLESATERFEPDNLIQLDFTLFAVIEPDRVAMVKRVRDRNDGRIRDRVIRVCRNTPRDDLLEPELTTLKAHLLDELQPLIGGPAVRRMGVHSVTLDEL